MEPFRKSLVKASFLSCILIAPILLSSVVTAHLSVNPPWARNLSFYFSGLGLVALICATFLGILLIKHRKITCLDTNTALQDISHSSKEKFSKLSLASFVLSFPLFGLVSSGAASIAGLILGYRGLQSIHSDETLKGHFFAITGMSLSTFTLVLIITGMLFVGPD